jgi:ribosomal protein L37E
VKKEEAFPAENIFGKKKNISHTERRKRGKNSDNWQKAQSSTLHFTHTDASQKEEKGTQITTKRKI